MNRKDLALIGAIVVLTLGCGLLPAEPEPPEAEAPTLNPTPAGEGNGPGDGGGFAFGENAQWPAYIPREIPELEGETRVIMDTPGSHVRIFYDSLSDRQIRQYLDQCEAAGFRLQYIVYTREGFTDTSEERRRVGDFDAVDLTKGKYHMRLEYGSDSVTYDIYAEGFEIPQ